MPLTPEVAKLRSRISVNTQYGRPEAADDARRELKTVLLARHIQEAVDSAPVPTAEQLARLRALLNPKGPRQ
jgi:hypothetical protein